MERLLKNTLFFLVRRSVAFLAGAGVCRYAFSVKLLCVAFCNNFQQEFQFAKCFPFVLLTRSLSYYGGRGVLCFRAVNSAEAYKESRRSS